MPPENALAILGQTAVGPDGKDIGRLVDVLVDNAGMPVAGVLDIGGFMGVGNRKVAVAWPALHFFPADKTHQIILAITPDQLRGMPEYKDTAKPAPVVVAPPLPHTAAPPAPAPASPAPPSPPAAPPAPPSAAPPSAESPSAESPPSTQSTPSSVAPGAAAATAKP